MVPASSVAPNEPDATVPGSNPAREARKLLRPRPPDNRQIPCGANGRLVMQHMHAGGGYWEVEVEVSVVVVAAALSLAAAGVLVLAGASTISVRVEVLVRPWLSVTT